MTRQRDVRGWRTGSLELLLPSSTPSSPAVLFSSAGRSPPHLPRTPLHKTFTLQQKGKELGLGARRDRTLPKWILQQRRAERGLQLSSGILACELRFHERRSQ